MEAKPALTERNKIVNQVSIYKPMINESLKRVMVLLNQAIDTPNFMDDTVFLGNIALADPHSTQRPSRDPTNKVVATVVNIEEERTLRNLPKKTTQRDANTNEPRIVTQAPPLYLNVYLLFSANNDNYEAALLYLSRIIGFFRTQEVFEFDVPNTIDPNVTTATMNVRLVFDLCSMNFQELNQLWGILGGKYIPSVLYKVRLAEIRAGVPQGGDIIRAIRRDEQAN